jgi:hypothetical protein
MLGTEEGWIFGKAALTFEGLVLLARDAQVHSSDGTAIDSSCHRQALRPCRLLRFEMHLFRADFSAHHADVHADCFIEPRGMLVELGVV